MNRYLKTVILAAVISVVASLKAESQRVDLGATSAVNVEISVVTNHSYEVRLYDDGNPVLTFDAGGVTFAASGIGYSLNQSGPYGYSVYGFTGEVSASLNIYNESQGSYSDYNAGNYATIDWSGPWNTFVGASFYP